MKKKYSRPIIDRQFVEVEYSIAASSDPSISLGDPGSAYAPEVTDWEDGGEHSSWGDF